MNDFIKILTHGRRLQGATKQLTIEELEDVSVKIISLIEKRKEALVKEEKELALKKEKIEAIRQQMLDAGLDISDFDAQLNESKSKQSRRKGQKRPIKYVLEQNGEEFKWTGIGRMPVVFKEALASGKTLEDFAI